MVPHALSLLQGRYIGSRLSGCSITVSQRLKDDLSNLLIDLVASESRNKEIVVRVEIVSEAKNLPHLRKTKITRNVKH